MLETLESLAWRVVTKADGGEGDETEIRGLYGGPSLPVSEEEGAGEDEGEDEDEVDHDGDHHQVGGHVPLLPHLVKSQPLGLSVHPRRQFRVPPSGSTPPTEDTAVEPPEGHRHPVSYLSHEDQEQRDPDEGVHDAEYLPLHRLRGDVAVPHRGHDRDGEQDAHVEGEVPFELVGRVVARLAVGRDHKSLEGVEVGSDGLEDERF